MGLLQSLGIRPKKIEYDTTQDRDGAKAIVIGDAEQTLAYRLPLCKQIRDELVENIIDADTFEARLALLEEAEDAKVIGVRPICFIDEQGKINPSIAFFGDEVARSDGQFYNGRVHIVKLENREKPYIIARAYPGFFFENDELREKCDKLKSLYKKNMVTVTKDLSQNFAHNGFAVYPAYTF